MLLVPDTKPSLVRTSKGLSISNETPYAWLCCSGAAQEIYMSIPYVYNRTGESYKIPEWTLDLLVPSGFARFFHACCHLCIGRNVEAEGRKQYIDAFQPQSWISFQTVLCTCTSEG
jgi:hypothetical protein